MDKIVIFDWGGVAMDDGLPHQNVIIRTLRRLGCNFSDEEILNICSEHIRHGANVHIDKITNPVDAAKWWDLGKNKLQVSMGYDVFSKTYEEEFLKVPCYQDVVDYAHSLKSRCKIGILSNLTLFDKNIIDAHYHLADFDKVYLSCELGMRKPDQEIYRYIQNDLKIPSQNILFLDNLAENVEAAKSCGWNACCVTGLELDKIKSVAEEFLA